MIELRTVRDELDRFDELHRARFCACCADGPEAQESDLRRAFERAAAKGNNIFLPARTAPRGGRPRRISTTPCAAGGWS